MFRSYLVGISSFDIASGEEDAGAGSDDSEDIFNREAVLRQHKRSADEIMAVVQAAKFCAADAEAFAAATWAWVAANAAAPNV